MKNAFPSLQAYQAFENLLEPHLSQKSVFRHWQPEVEPDDNLGDIFVQAFPLLEEVEVWSLHDLNPPVDILTVNENTSSARSASTSFVSVRIIKRTILFVTIFIVHMNSILPELCIQQSSRLISTVHPQYSRPDLLQRMWNYS